MMIVLPFVATTRGRRIVRVVVVVLFLFDPADHETLHRDDQTQIDILYVSGAKGCLDQIRLGSMCTPSLHCPNANTA